MAVALVIIGSVVLIGLFVMSMYNGLVSLRNNVKNAYAQMDVQMKNRADLIPGLIETVKGAAGHEKGTLEAVIKARSQVLNAATPEQSMEANNQMTWRIEPLDAPGGKLSRTKSQFQFPAAYGRTKRCRRKDQILQTVLQ